MKNLILPIFCFFLLSLASVQARMTVVVIGGGGAAAAGCPSWGTYYFAWDGDHATGNTEACLDSGNSTVTGTQSGGTFQSDEASVTWESTAAAHDLYWDIAENEVDCDDATGITVWIRLKVTTLTAGESITLFTIVGNINNYTEIMAKESGGDYWFHDGYFNTTQKSLGFTAATHGSYVDLTYSFKEGEAGNDHYLYDGTTSDEEDQDMTWNAAEDLIYVSAYYTASEDGNTYRVQSIWIGSGYKAAKPW